LSNAIGQLIHYVSDYKRNVHTSDVAKSVSKEKIYFLNPRGLLVFGTDKTKFKNLQNDEEKAASEAEYCFSNFCYTLHNIDI
jgi:hypothetical protein